MRPRALVVAICALTVAGAAVTGAAAQSGATGPARLAPFADCRSFGSYMSAHALPYVGRAGGVVGIAVGAPSAAPGKGSARATADPEFSGTNVQEEGVDEPDSVKTDGRTLFVASGGRINAVDVRSRSPRLLDTLRLEDGASYELLLRGDRLLALSRTLARPCPARRRGSARSRLCRSPRP